MDAAGAPAGEAPVRTLLSQIDPAQALTSDSSTVNIGASASPDGRFGLVGPTGPARLNRRMRDDHTAARLWAVAQDLTGTTLPA